MTLDGRQIITHLGFLAVGLAVGIYLARGGSPPPQEIPVTKTNPETTAAAENPQNPAGSEANDNIGRSTPNDQQADPVLIKMRDDYYDQIQKGESRQALLVLQEMEKKAPQSQIYLETNSEYLIYAKDWQGAAAAAGKCTGLYPKSRPCFRNLATAELQDGSTDEQAAAVDSCLALEPNDPQCRNMKGIVQMNGGDYSGAIAIYEKLIQDNGSYGMRFNDDHLEWQLGLALEGAGRREEALDHLENACRRNNNQACRKIEEISGGGFD